MKIGINSGHTKSGAGYGAVGLIKESEHTRLVGQALMDKLSCTGATVIDCTIDQAETQAEYLAAAVALANRQELDWFLSIHFNASTAHTGHGVEVYTFEGRQQQEALTVCSEIAALGFTNRGVKDGSGLYVIHKTKAKAMLIEVCFCDNESEVTLYHHAGGADAIAEAICRALVPCAAENDSFTVQTQLLAEMTREQFADWIGAQAAEDMKHSGILASVTAAQACLEAAYGKSELALKALNLGGMKATLSFNNWPSVWNGKVYRKWTKEQNPDGSYRNELADFRKYDSISDYLKDHSAYLAGAKKGNALRYEGIVGCTDYRKALQIIKDGGYATSHDYVENCCKVIEQNNLTRFDIPDEAAPEGYAYVVQAGVYKKSKKAAEELKRRLESMGVVTEVKLYSVE